MAAWNQAGVAGRLAMLGLFCLPALVVTTPQNLLPFGVLLLLSSVIGAPLLWRARVPAAVGLPLLGLTGLQLSLAGLSVWQAGLPLRELDNLSRLLVVPWCLLWVQALRPGVAVLWWGAVAGIAGALVLALGQIWAGAERASGWINAIVLADVVVVLLVLVIWCRPPRRVGVVLAAMLATVAVVVLSGSRGVWPALAVVLLAAVVGGERRAVRRRLMLVMVAALLGLTALLVSPALREQVRLHELQQDLARLQQGDANSSAGARIERLQVAWHAFGDAPLQGVGLGQFDRAMTVLPACQGSAQQAKRCHLDHAHNDLAEWAATRGVPGVIGLLAMYGIPWLVFAGLWQRSGRPLLGPAVAGMAVVGVYAVCGLTQSMFAHQTTSGLYACLVGLLAGLALPYARPAAGRR